MSNWVQECRNAAAIMVCGFQFNPRTGRPEPRAGEWADAWWEHGLVQQAEREGWGRELRAHAILAIGKRIMFLTVGKPDDMPRFEDVVRDVDDFMPKQREWIEAARHEGLRTRLADEQRNPIDPTMTERLVNGFKANPEAASGLLRIAMGVREVEKKRLPADASRPAIEHMQRTSRNNVHRTLSGLSRRMTGETE
jgi:hypothetical protein